MDNYAYLTKIATRKWQVIAASYKSSSGREKNSCQNTSQTVSNIFSKFNDCEIYFDID